ncbi:fatty acid-binding protein, partial [Pyxidicoccus sp. 3LG]
MRPTRDVFSSNTKELTARLARSMGVTRVARVTGLDRTGVEVACAVRPGGHVLQVCNGKGLTYAEAAWGALLETAELWAAETVRPDRLVWGARSELDGRLGTLWSAEALGSAGRWWTRACWGDGVRCAWRSDGAALGAPVWVPAQGLRCPGHPGGTRAGG